MIECDSVCESECGSGVVKCVDRLCVCFVLLLPHKTVRCVPLKSTGGLTVITAVRTEHSLRKN
jgi:hypothetical protein